MVCPRALLSTPFLAIDSDFRQYYSPCLSSLSGDGGWPDAERRGVRQRDLHHAWPQLWDRRAIVTVRVAVEGRNQDHRVLQLTCKQGPFVDVWMHLKRFSCNHPIGYSTIQLKKNQKQTFSNYQLCFLLNVAPCVGVVGRLSWECTKYY